MLTENGYPVLFTRASLIYKMGKTKEATQLMKRVLR